MTQTDRGAVLSPCGTYRYHLWRKVPIDGVGGTLGSRVAFVMLNPSTADAAIDDPTIRKCIGYARRWGCEWLDVVNLFALRATDPKELYRAGVVGQVGADNDATIVTVCGDASLIVCAWGRHGALLDRGRDLAARLRQFFKLHYLKLNGDGSPAHVLYLKGDLQPTEWTP